MDVLDVAIELDERTTRVWRTNIDTMRWREKERKEGEFDKFNFVRRRRQRLE